MILIDSKPCRYQILLIGISQVATKLHTKYTLPATTHPNTKVIIFDKIFEQLHMICYSAFGQFQKDFWDERLAAWTSYVFLPYIILCLRSQVLRYWVTDHSWPTIEILSKMPGMSNDLNQGMSVEIFFRSKIETFII